MSDAKRIGTNKPISRKLKDFSSSILLKTYLRTLSNNLDKNASTKNTLFG